MSIEHLHHFFSKHFQRNVSFFKHKFSLFANLILSPTTNTFYDSEYQHKIENKFVDEKNMCKCRNIIHAQCQRDRNGMNVEMNENISDLQFSFWFNMKCVQYPMLSVSVFFIFL